MRRVLTLSRRDYDYHPYYCEENIYRLAAALRENSRGALHAVFITNARRQVALGAQRLAPPGDVVLWDYHVVLLIDSVEPAGRWVADFDTRLPFVTPLDDYVGAAIPPEIPTAYRPRFRVVPGETFLDRFSTDRRHMRNGAGGYIHPPPPWPPPRGAGAASPHELPAFLDPAATTATIRIEGADG